MKCFKNEDKRFAKYSISWRQSIIRVNLVFINLIPIIALPRHSVGALVKSKRSVSYALSAMGWDVDINFHNADVNIIFHYADIIKHYADHFSHFQFPLAFRADFGPLSLSGQLPGQFLHWIFPMQY